MVNEEDFRELIRAMITDYARLYDNASRTLPQRVETFDNILKSRKSSKALKAVAILGKQAEYRDLDGYSSRLSFLNLLHALFNQIEILQISIGNIDTQLKQSKIIENAKEIANTKKVLKKLLKSIREDVKRVTESRANDLFYVE